MSTEERNALLKELRDMLKRMHRNFKHRNVDWEYRMVVSSFLETDVSATSTPLSVQNSQGEMSPASTGESVNNVNMHTDPTQDINSIISALDRDTLISLVQSSLREEGGAQTSRRLKPLRVGNDHEQERIPSSEYSMYSSGSESQQSTQSTPIIDYRDLPGPSNQENLDNFMENSTQDLYLYVKPYHTFPTANTVSLNGVLTPIKWHHSRQAFTVLKRNHQDDIPYMGQYHAHDTLLAFQNAQPGAIFKDNMSRKCYSRHFEESSGLAKALRLLKEETPTVLSSMLRNTKGEKGQVPFQQEAFKILSMVNFETGWSLTGSNYMDWAGGHLINLDKVADELDLTDFTPYVPQKYLERERNTRARLVNHISGMDMLEALTGKLFSQPAFASFSQAISRHFTAPLKDYTMDWMTAKLDIRKFVLQGQTSVPAKNLLKSNLWEPSLFGKAALSEEKNRSTMNICLQKNIGITKYYNTGLSRFGRNTLPEELGTSYISRRSKDGESQSRGRNPSRRRRRTQKPYSFESRTYDYAVERNQPVARTNQTNKQPQRQQSHQSQEKETHHSKGKSKNYGKGKSRNFQKNKK